MSSPTIPEQLSNVSDVTQEMSDQLKVLFIRKSLNNFTDTIKSTTDHLVTDTIKLFTDGINYLLNLDSMNDFDKVECIVYIILGVLEFCQYVKINRGGKFNGLDVRMIQRTLEKLKRKLENFGVSFIQLIPRRGGPVTHSNEYIQKVNDLISLLQTSPTFREDQMDADHRAILRIVGKYLETYTTIYSEIETILNSDLDPLIKMNTFEFLILGYIRYTLDSLQMLLEPNVMEVTGDFVGMDKEIKDLVQLRQELTDTGMFQYMYPETIG